MSAVYNYSKARQNLAAVLEQAAREGEVRIKRKDGQVFVIRPEPGKDSPLDIEGLSLDISTDEIVSIIRHGRENRDYQWSKRRRVR
jgi:PHD/YefM family antitoxin component YafN of YafNO toxin-antitoxin module